MNDTNEKTIFTDADFLPTELAAFARAKERGLEMSRAALAIAERRTLADLVTMGGDPQEAIALMSRSAAATQELRQIAAKTRARLTGTGYRMALSVADLERLSELRGVVARTAAEVANAMEKTTNDDLREVNLPSELESVIAAFGMALSMFAVLRERCIVEERTPPSESMARDPMLN